MIVNRIEYHQMTSTCTYDIPDEDIVSAFDSIANFLEAEVESSDKFYDFICEYDYDREDDVWTERKGGYDIDYMFE
jgi:hypothetical protein|tara:strand:- start:30 stop:257 length:228 start_codon:yes stop_codon:yes gene_type:complete